MLLSSKRVHMAPVHTDPLANGLITLSSLGNAWTNLRHTAGRQMWQKHHKTKASISEKEKYFSFMENRITDCSYLNNTNASQLLNHLPLGKDSRRWEPDWHRQGIRLAHGGDCKGWWPGLGWVGLGEKVEQPRSEDEVAPGEGERTEIGRGLWFSEAFCTVHAHEYLEIIPA